MRLDDFSHLECPLARALDAVGEWWSLLIVRDLFYGIRTFDALRDDLGIARNVLAKRLKKLEAKGVLEKREYQPHPRRYSYGLTKKGKDLFPVILTLVEWANRWEAPEGPIIEIEHASGGHAIHPELVCGECKRAVDYKQVRLKAGPGAQRPEALPLPLRTK
ncbi:MAG: transcriptional regulator [Myxococcales bacterium]|nr:MAG: transcriptional regulator [Myxococcales bacterium]